MAEFTEFVLWMIPGAPLLAAVLIAVLGSAWFKERSHWLCAGAIGLSLAGSLWLLASGAGTADEPTVARGFQWIAAGDIDIHVDLRADAMTVIMLTTVTFVSLLVAIYASGYMHGDPGYPRFFAEVSLFVFSMCMLVLADNFAVVFVFWEAVGLCSYLLIGFWFRRPSAAAAAKKAFVVNRIGDFGLLIGLFLIWTTFGTLEFNGVLGNEGLIAQVAEDHPGRLTVICLLLFLGAMGKSAQFPLHVWLPDAMEGPTPVSALIHAATMVTAGVYLVARATPLFMHAPEAQLTVAVIGGITAVVAALIALTQFDLKRVLAYSTVSQLGYMFLALGAGAVGHHAVTAAVTAAMFHLFTHAFFKALLFLGSGSVMHAMGDVIDMRRFGGLRHVMPRTHWTFLAGAAALAGAPLLAGFWSKDEILVALAHGIGEEPYGAWFAVLLAAAIVTAVLTAFYTFRAYFLTFWGEERIPPEAGHHAHESPPSMTIPLVILAVMAIAVGLAVGPTGLFASYIEHTQGLPDTEPHHIDWIIAAGGTLAALVGIGIAIVMYVTAHTLPERIGRLSGPLYPLSQNKFYLDELYFWSIVWPLRAVGQIAVLFDQYVIDTLLDVIAWVPGAVGRGVRPVQDGLVPSYALVMLMGLAALLISMLVIGS